MKSTPQHSIRLAHSTVGPVSRAHKQFNTLIKKLEAARSLLASWKETLDVVASTASRDYWPLVTLRRERFRQLVLLLDEMHDHTLLGKRERDKLGKFIVSTALDLLADEDDEVIKAIYNRRGGADFDEQEAESKAEIRRMMETMLGAEFKGDIDVRSPEAMMRAFQAQLDEQDIGADPEAETEAHPGEPRQKRAADTARERRQAAEAQRMQQSMRDIFRKLASKLHPDREADEAERRRKTGLMQRVNAAYAANDMLGLLELQLEVEQISQAGLADLGDERIKQYNKVLKEQLGEIEREIAELEDAAAAEMGADLFDEVTPDAMRGRLDTDIADLRITIEVLDEDLQSLHDVKLLKAWLKDLLPSTSKRQRDDNPFR